MHCHILFLLLSCWYVLGCHSLNILGLATYDGNSHWAVMRSVFEALLQAGHHVTVVAPYALPPSPNISSIDVSKVLPPRRNAFTYDLLMEEYYKPWQTLHVLPNLSLNQCKKIHAMEEVRQLINGSRKFDVIITEIFGADCDAVFSNLLHAPLISVIASTHLPWASARVGNPENPSYVSHILTPYAENMSFSRRMINSFFHIYSYLTAKYYATVTTSENRKNFGSELPSTDEIVGNTSLIFVNSHFSVDTPRPFVPSIVEIGGIHLPPVKNLPKELAKILDNSKNGVVYFSLGSIIKATSLPRNTINAIRSTFAELEFDVFWKFEDESIDVTPNVHVRKWFPQRDILAHPKTKLAIIHGGMMSVFEVVDSGIPVLGVPLFFDQHRNVMNLVSKGMALRMDIDKITKDKFKENVRKLLFNKMFKSKATELSERFRDRPLKPSQAVVYWTEYVAKHEGGRHMRAPAADVPLYQLLLLDVFAVVLVSFTIIAYTIGKLLKLINCIFSQHRPRTKTKTS